MTVLSIYLTMVNCINLNDTHSIDSVSTILLKSDQTESTQFRLRGPLIEANFTLKDK